MYVQPEPKKDTPGQSTGRGVRLPYLSVQDVFLVAVPEVAHSAMPVMAQEKMYSRNREGMVPK